MSLCLEENMSWFTKNKKNQTQNATHNMPPQNALFVSDYLNKENIRFFPAGTDKNAILTGLVKSLSYHNPDTALKAILARETAGSTEIAPGLFVPHARLVDVPDILVSMGICPAGLYVLFLGPQNNMKRNLDFLASVSALFQTETLAGSLMETTTPDAILSKIRETEKQ